MAKIICITSGLTGILNASFELVNRLKKNGHDVSYASPRSISSDLQTEEIRFYQLPAIDIDVSPPIPDFSKPFRKVKKGFYKILNFKSRRKESLENISPYNYASLLERENPDLVILDIELHEYIFKSYNLNQKFVLLSQWFSLWNQKGLPYLLHETIPLNGWAGSHLMMSFSWKIVCVQRYFMFLKKRLISGGTDRRSALQMLANKCGFPSKYIRQNFWPGPFTYDKLPVLSITAYELEFPHKVRDNLHYIGPMVAENRIERPSISFTGKSLESILEDVERSDSKLLYCSVSTLSMGDVDFINKIIEAVRTESNWTLIVGLGDKIREEFAKNLPSNVFLFSYVSQLKVLKNANISINHGGIHTINECIHFKVPMLVYSGKKSDQNGCAARVAYHKVGLAADKDTDSSIEIRKKIEKVLNDSNFMKRIESLHNASEKYKRNKNMENIIQNIIINNQ